MKEFTPLGVRNIPESKRRKVRDTVAHYIEAKRLKDAPEPTPAEIGFMRKNGVEGKSEAEIDALLSVAKRLGNGEVLGVGDQFLRWCARNGRPVPSSELIALMNSDPQDAGIAVRGAIPESPHIYRAYCSFIAGKGRPRV